MSACVCALRAVFPRLSKRSIPVYTDVCDPHIMKTAQFKEDSNRCRKRRETQLRCAGGAFLHQRGQRILPGAPKQQLSIRPSHYSGCRDRDRRFPDSFLLSPKPLPLFPCIHPSFCRLSSPYVPRLPTILSFVSTWA